MPVRRVGSLCVSFFKNYGRMCYQSRDSVALQLPKRSLFCLPDTSPLRQKMVWLCKHPAFDYSILCVNLSILCPVLHTVYPER